MLQNMISQQTISASNRELIEDFCLAKGMKNDLNDSIYQTKVSLATTIRSEMSFKINVKIHFMKRGQLAQIRFETSNRLQIQGAILAFLSFILVLFLIHESIYILIPSLMAGLFFYIYLHVSFQKSLDKALSLFVKDVLSDLN